MIPASHSLVTFNPARQAALQAIAEVEQRREERKRLSDDHPVTRAFLRRLTGQSRLTHNTARLIPGLAWDPSFRFWTLNKLENALERLLVSQGEHCFSPMSEAVQQCLFPDVVWRNTSRAEKRAKLRWHKVQRREDKRRCHEAMLHQSLVARARVDLNFQSPETVGAWYSRWSDELHEYELAPMFWLWRRRFVSLDELLWHWDAGDPLWVVFSVLRDIVNEQPDCLRGADRRSVPDKLSHSEEGGANAG
ncbi:PsiA protein [Kosakonia arachidis]|uniref:PsiA protein n=1 Tax=Kosakonia arachidis TaxID=551989 RepID=A0A1I7EA32_9ENTR|nr:plasmid SOS inhibition protein A [Kosakonia arachidis]SFU20752.1 PsiA protein [Kosakonia arachidis]